MRSLTIFSGGILRRRSPPVTSPLASCCPSSLPKSSVPPFRSPFPSIDVFDDGNLPQENSFIYVSAISSFSSFGLVEWRIWIWTVNWDIRSEEILMSKSEKEKLFGSKNSELNKRAKQAPLLPKITSAKNGSSEENMI
ncbi:hypothetical protein HN873_014737 [Arachis hypogaea]